MSDFIVLKSGPLILREININDVTKKYVNWLNDPDVNQHLESRFVLQNDSTVKNFVEDCNKSKTVFLFGIFIEKNNKHIGNIKLGPINKYHNHAEIGLMIGDKSEWGKGYGSRAIFEVTNFAFNQLKISKVNAGCYESNTGSKKSFNKVGYKVEGVLKEHVVFNGHREDVLRFGCFPYSLNYHK